jgi:hypothetical protein
MEGAIVKIKKKDGETDEEAIARAEKIYPKGTVFEVQSDASTTLTPAVLADAQAVDPKKVDDLPATVTETYDDPPEPAPPSRGGFTLYKWDPDYSGTRKGLDTVVQFEELSLDSTLKFKSDGSWKLGKFTNYAEYLERVDELVEKLIQKYRGWVVDPESENYADLVRSPVNLGFTHRVLDSMNEENYLTYRDMFGDANGVNHERSRRRDPNDTNQGDFSYYGLDVERELNEAINRLEDADYVEPGLLHEYLKLYLSDPEYHVDPLPLEYDARFYRMYVPRLGYSYDTALTHVQYKRTIVDYMYSMVKSLVNVEISNYSSDFSALLRSLDVNVTQINNIGSISRGLKPDDAVNLINSIITCQIMGKHARLDFNFVGSSYNFDISTLIHCIVAKLVVPRQIIDKESEVQIDNYIFLWLFQPFLNQVQVNVVTNQLRSATALSLAGNRVNYLTLFFNNGNNIHFNGNNASEAAIAGMRGFMASDDAGNGWNIPHSVNPRERLIQINQNLQRFNRGGISWTPYNGTVGANPDIVNTAINTPEQYDRFSNFVTGLVALVANNANARKLSIKPKEVSAIIAVMDRIRGSFETIMIMGNQINKITEKLCHLPTSRPYTNRLDIVANNGIDMRIKMTVKLGAPMSMMLLSPSIKTVAVTAEHFESSHVICYAVEVLREVYADVRDRYAPFKYNYTKSRINEIVKARVAKHPSLSGFFGLLKPQLDDLLINNRLFGIQAPLPLAALNVVTYIEVMKLVRIIIEQPQYEWMLGITREWYFCPNPKDDYLAVRPPGRTREDYREYNYFKSGILLRVRPGDVVETYNTYEELYNDVRTETIAAKFQQCLRSVGKIIIFKFPINLNHENEVPGKLLGYASLPPAVDLELQRGVSSTSILRTLEARYTLHTDRRRNDHNSQVMLARPLFWVSTDDQPHREVTDPATQQNFTRFQQRIIAKYEYNDVTHSSFFNISKRLDI